MVLNSNLRVPIPETLSFSLFEGLQRPPIGSTKAHKKPQIVQNKTSNLITFHISIRFFQNFPKCRNICYERTISIADPGKTLFRVPGGLLGLKTPHFLWFF